MTKAYVKKQIGNLEEMASRMEDFCNTLEERYSNGSESWQESPRGEKVQEQIGALHNAMAYIEDVISSLDVFNEDV